MKRLLLSDLRIEAKLTAPTAELTFSLRDGVSIGGGLTWSGKIRGPFCEQRQTLVANYPFRAGKRMEEGCATIPDFCPWSSAAPFTYQLELELRRSGEVAGSLQERLALHWITVHQGKIYQAGKRWVPRLARLHLGVDATEHGRKELQELLAEVRERDLVLVVKQGEDSDALLSVCLRDGVAVAIEAASIDVAALARWESFGCVVFILNRGAGSSAARTSVLLAEREAEEVMPDAMRWRIFRGGLRTEAQLLAREAMHDSAEEARRACDRLQADSALIGDWAAYLA